MQNDSTEKMKKMKTRKQKQKKKIKNSKKESLESLYEEPSHRIECKLWLYSAHVCITSLSLRSQIWTQLT